MRRSLSFVVRQFVTRTSQAGEGASQSRKRAGVYLAAGLILVSMLFSACSSPFGGSSVQVTPTSSTRALSKIGWCAKPLMVFRDENAITPTASPTSTATSTSGTPAAGPGTPSTITDWSVVKANLGFSTYLPTTLPNGACLVSAAATIHDQILGGSFTIGYLFLDHTSLSLSEAPLLKSQSNVSFQCNPTGLTTPTTTGKTGTPTATSTATPNQLCIGSKGNTSITLAGAGTVDHLQQVFNTLQANVDWIPA